MFCPAVGTGQILGGLISFAFQHMSINAELSGWRTMFLTLGLVSVLFGVFILFYIPDTPMSAKFLNNDEKVVLLEHIKVNQTGIENRHFHPSQLIEGVLDVGCKCARFFFRCHTSRYYTLTHKLIE